MTINNSGQSSPQRQTNTSVIPPKEFRYTKEQRLLNAADFTNVFNDAPIRAAHPSFLILARKNTHKSARLGLVIAKKHVKRAVGRNLIKRTARESFRLQQHKLTQIDAIVLARRGADTLSATELRKIFNGLWKRISKRAQST